MNKLSIILFSVFLLAACQPSDEAKEPVVEAEKTASEKTQTDKEAATDADPESIPAGTHGENDGHGHNHGLDVKAGSGAPFEEVTSDLACETPIVIEFFAYQCPHCYNLESAAEAWRKKTDGKVEFLSVPTHLGRNEFGSLLLVHHAAQKLGVLDKARHALFERVHTEKKLFANPEEAADFLAEQGANRAEALAMVNDQKAMGEKIEADFQMMSQYKITSVPKVLVNHKYMTDITAAGGTEAVFELVDELLTKENNCKPQS